MTTTKPTTLRLRRWVIFLFWLTLFSHSNNHAATFAWAQPLTLMGVIMPQCYNETLVFNQMATILNATLRNATCEQNVGFDGTTITTTTCDYTNLAAELDRACTLAGGVTYDADPIDVLCPTETFHYFFYRMCIGPSCNRMEFESLALLSLEEQANTILQQQQQQQQFGNCTATYATETNMSPHPTITMAPTEEIMMPASNGSEASMFPPTAKPSNGSETSMFPPTAKPSNMSGWTDPAMNSTFVQCADDTSRLELEMNYSDYSVEFDCDQGTNVCTKQFPIDHDLTLCTSLSGIYYLGDISLTCLNITLQMLNWGICTASDCDPSSIQIMFQNASFGMTYQLMMSRDGFLACLGSVDNIHQAVANNETNLATNATDTFPSTNTTGNATLSPHHSLPTVSNVSTLPPFTVRPVSNESSMSSQCQQKTTNLETIMDYADYDKTTFDCDNATGSCTKEYPMERDFDSCERLGGIFYTGDISIDCHTTTTVRLLHWGMCTGQNCSLHSIEVMFNNISQEIASQWMLSNNPSEGCRGSASNIIAFRQSGTLPPTLNVSTQKPTTHHIRQDNRVASLGDRVALSWPMSLATLLATFGMIWPVLCIG